MVTIDTNIAIYAFSPDPKSRVADALVRRADFVSAQVGNEYANVMRRKFKQSWQEIDRRVEVLHDIIPSWYAVERSDTREALRLAGRYKFQFYDALLIAVGLAHGATTLYSEDMQDGLVVEDTLRIVNPFTNDLA